MNNASPLGATLLIPAVLAGLAWPAVATADRYRTTQHDFGGVGLLQTPTARMAEEGGFSFNANRTSPYSRYSISVQPLPWLEGTIRYMAITNRLYGPQIAGDQSYKDKAIDAKARLWKESYWLPQIALGMRDVGGTGLFSSEYLVANKRFQDLDFSVGLAWGYIGNRGDLRNPLGLVHDGFDERPSNRTSAVVGDFNQDNYFRGRPGVFGGVEYQTPWKRLRLKAELDGNDYQNEPQRNNQRQDSPINLGAVFAVTKGIDVTTAWERGNTLMVGVTFHTNLSGALPPKPLDPPPVPRAASSSASTSEINWADVSRSLHENAGFKVKTIASREGELIVTGEQVTFRDEAKGLGRASRILDNAAGDDYDWHTLVNKPRGLPTNELSIRAYALRDYENNAIDIQALRRSTVNAAPAVVSADVLHEEPLDNFTYGLSLGYNQNIGGPDGFFLYQFLARVNTEYRFNANNWMHASVAGNLTNNFDKFRYDAPSNLPRVRTDIREYLTSSDVAIENLQYTHTLRLQRDLYAMAYVGLLESMFGGAGGELLYHPHNDSWAFGLDANWVRQRGYRRDFDFRDYSTWTGHATGYLQTGYHDVLVKGSVGRYLAGDYGATLDLSRRFDNGVTVGAWATKTNVTAEQFGEGSFDKGIYFTFPFDAFFARSTNTVGTMVWNPLTRDGGARLGRYYQLYDLTQGADVRRLNKGFENIGD